MESSLLIKEDSEQYTDTVTENHNQPKVRIVEASPHRNIWKMLPHLRLRKHCGRGNRKIARARESGVFCDTVSPRNVRAMPIKSHQHDFPNEN